MYGTHYSAPAFAAYFLVREHPEWTLHLHGGKFDEADRSFFSLSETWAGVLRSTADVKELIPQFYAPELHSPASASFLINARALHLGRRQDGVEVNDVSLPPWAHSSPRELSRQLRAALESPLCSAMLHSWIDLIFGYKQRGHNRSLLLNLKVSTRTLLSCLPKQ